MFEHLSYLRSHRDHLFNVVKHEQQVTIAQQQVVGLREFVRAVNQGTAQDRQRGELHRRGRERLGRVREVVGQQLGQIVCHQILQFGRRRERLIGGDILVANAIKQGLEPGFPLGRGILPLISIKRSSVWWLERNRLWVVGHFQFRLSVPIGSTDSLLDIASQLLESRPRASLIVLGSNTRRNVLE